MGDEPLLAPIQVGDDIPTAVFGENGHRVGAAMCGTFASSAAVRAETPIQSGNGRSSSTAGVSRSNYISDYVFWCIDSVWVACKGGRACQTI